MSALGAIKRSLRRVLCDGLYFSGVAAWLLRLRLRRRAVVLMYHRVLPPRPASDSFSADAIVVTPDTFAMHLQLLQRFLAPVSVTQFGDMLGGRVPWQPGACLVTFDDGWHDNVVHAVPALQRARVPAVIFLATGYVGTQDVFWQESLTRQLFAAWRSGPGALPLFESQAAASILQLDESQAREEIRSLVERLKRVPRDQVDTYRQQVRRYLDSRGSTADAAGDDRFMTWEQARSLAGTGNVEIGSHAHSHRPLTSLTPQEVDADLRTATEILARELGGTPRWLAYPNGNHDDAVVERVGRSGIELAFTTRVGLVAAGDAPLRLKRINIAEHGTDHPSGFVGRLLGI